MLELSTVAAWGARPVESITKRDVVALIDRMHDERGPAAANMAHTWVRSFFVWLADRDVIAASPATGVRLPARLGARDRVLATTSCGWSGWRPASSPAVRRFRPDVGLDRAAAGRGGRDDRRRAGGDIWTIPRERAKNGVAHAVPLAPEAMAVLAGVPRIGPASFVFTLNGRDRSAAIAGQRRRSTGGDEARGGGRARAAAAWTIHDLRRTAPPASPGSASGQVIESA